MRLRLILATTLVAACALAAQTTITYRPKQGQTYTDKFSADLQVGGMSAKVTANLATTVTSASDEKVELSTVYKDFKVEVGGNEMESNVTTETVKLGPKLQILKVEGGVDGTDAVQWLIVRSFVPPTETDLKPGLKYTHDLPKTEDGVPAVKYEGEYIGTEDVAGKPTHKFKTKFKAEGDDALSGTQTVWVKADGTLVKLESEFKNMDVPVAGAKADGKATLEVVAG